LILGTADPWRKATLSRTFGAAWQAGQLNEGDWQRPPDRPARPARPALLPPRDMPRRKVGGAPEKRIALLHALAHIELNAIDLAWDLIARFGAPPEPRALRDDWVKVGMEEALHFELLAQHLETLGARYGDLPAHDGLWQMAEETAHDLLARLAVVPLVLEARGLDITPGTIAAFDQYGDKASADILRTIYRDEIGHVAIGARWFRHGARARALDPAKTWRDLVKRHFRGQLKPPFNRAARTEAGLPEDFYADM